MKDLRLSIIIPFYNVEQYISQCLDSVYNQDIPEEEYEVICVNDASPDHSRDIVLEYQKKHGNLILLEHEVNKTLGPARNTGLDIAQGKYVWFLDSDDYILHNCLSEVLSLCEENNLEVLHWAVREDTGQWFTKMQDSGIISGKEDLLLGSQDWYTPWNRILNREFLLNNDLRFGDYPGNDVLFVMSLCKVAGRMMNRAKSYVIYRTNNPSSAQHTINTAERFFSYDFSLQKKVWEFSHEISSEFVSIVTDDTVERMRMSFFKLLRLPLKEQILFYGMLDDAPDIKGFVASLPSNRFHLAMKCPLLIMLVSPAYKVKRRIKATVRRKSNN